MFVNWLSNFQQAQGCQLLSELSGQSGGKIRPPQYFPFLRAFGLKENTILSVWMEKE